MSAADSAAGDGHAPAGGTGIASGAPATSTAARAPVASPVVWIVGDTEHARRFMPDGVSLHEVPTGDDLPGSLGSGDMLIAPWYTPHLGVVMQRIDGLQVVQVLSAGVDSMLPHVPAGVTLCDGSGIHDAPVAEWVVMAILAMRRNLPSHVIAQHERRWHGQDVGRDLEDATVLIVGHGSIGRAVEQRLAPFGARIERVARHARDGVHAIDELPDLLPHADVVVVLVPLTPETHHLVDASFIGRMQHEALLVNAARGPVVDTAALLTALNDRRILAALDVTDPEPLPDGHPLFRAPGVLITPHVGGAVLRFYERAWRFAGEQVGRFERGEPLRNVVDTY